MNNISIKDYYIQSELGRGGMATVYLAHDNKFDTNVAVKVLNKEFVHNENIRKRFLAEARNMFKMSHPNIIKVIDLIEEGETVAFVMEYIEGETLKEFIDRKGKLSDEEIRNLFTQMLEAVGYVHEQSLVHRDIKPSNFMLDRKGRIKLMDFGIAKNMNVTSSDYTHTGTNQNMGTPMYMSPEQIKSTKDVTLQSDIYSLGVVLWQMVTGQKPYDLQTLSTFELQTKIVNEALLPSKTVFDELILFATQKELTKRIKNCEDFKLVFLNGYLNKDKKNSINNQDLTIIENTRIIDDFEKTLVENINIDSVNYFEGKRIINDEVNNFIVKKLNEIGDEKYGIIDLKGNWILQPKYNHIIRQMIGGEVYYSIQDFVEINWIKEESKWSLLKKDSLECIYSIQCEDVAFYDNQGYSSASICQRSFFDSKTFYGKIDLQGKWVINPIYEYLGDIDKNGLFLFKHDGKEGVMNLKGDVYLSNKFDSIQGLDELGYRVWVKNKSGVVNKNGEWIIQPLFDGIHSFNKKLLAVALTNNHNSFGVINQKGEWVIKPIYDNLIGVEDNEFWIASKNGKHGIIDINNKWLLQPKFDYLIDAGVNGCFFAEVNNKFGIINQNGNWLIEPKFRDIQRINGVKGYFYAPLDDTKYGIINLEGKWVVDPLFDYVILLH